MSEEMKFGKRFRMNTVDKIILTVVIVLMVVMAVLSIMSRAGYMLIEGGLYIFGAFGGLALVLGWGGYALVRVFKKRTTRMLMGILLAVVMFILVTIGSAFIAMFTTVTIPSEFDTVVNGERQVVILKGYDVDEERLNIRYQERAAANPDIETEPGVEDYGFCYYAYPKAFGIFYRTNADTEGEVYVNQNSEATLMIEWTDENTAHLFIENPGIAEGGDWYLRY